MTRSPSEMDATNLSPREYMLRTAENLVTSDRSNEYGDPTDSLQRCADMMAAYLGKRDPRDLQAVDAAAFGIILKLSRLAHNPYHADSWIDVAGYASLGFEATKKTSLAAGLGDVLRDALDD